MIILRGNLCKKRNVSVTRDGDGRDSDSGFFYTMLFVFLESCLQYLFLVSSTFTQINIGGRAKNARILFEWLAWTLRNGRRSKWRSGCQVGVGAVVRCSVAVGLRWGLRWGLSELRLAGVCRAGAGRGALRGGAARARAGRRAAADAALRRPRVPRHARHRPPGAAARGRWASAELCKSTPLHNTTISLDIHTMLIDQLIQSQGMLSFKLFSHLYLVELLCITLMIIV